MKPRLSYRKRSYRTGLGLAAVIAGTLASACGNYVDVRTAVAPEAVMLGTRQTFAVVEAKADSSTSSALNDPMIDNSITSRAVHDQVKAAFEARGYRYTTQNPDFLVTYQATIAPIMDIYSTTYGGGYYGYRSFYGYSGYYDPYWTDPYGYGHAVGTFERSRVIIDALDPGSGKLLWRGEGTSGEYSDSKRFVKELGHAVKAVAKKFPPVGSGAAFVAYR
jgi:uncharacterized protein DUF4136